MSAAILPLYGSSDMANEFLTVKQAQYLLQKWKSEADAEFVAKDGDTMTGKLILGGGVAITTAPKDTAPDYFLTLHESFANGGTVGWISKADMKSGIGFDGTITERNGSATNVTTATDTTLCNSGSLSAGTYILQCMAQFAASSSGRRVIFLATSTSG